MTPLPRPPTLHRPSPSPSRRCRRGGVALLALAVAALAAHADPYTLPNTEVRELPHSANGRDYTLYVGLPASYASSPARHYPVIYACDGYWDFPLLMAEVGNLTYDNAMPECIVVGLAYAGTAPNVGALRQLDLTPGIDPWTDPSGTTSGHAQEYLSVIANQIIPFIESQYRVDPGYRVLTGSSYGGLFTVYALFERPGLFQGYIAPSPSLWWRSNFLLTRERDYARATTVLPARLYLTWGSDESSSIQDTTRQMYAQLKTSNYSSFAVTAREMTGERHSGPKGESFNRGLRFVFAPLAPLPSTAMDPGFATRSTLINLSTRGRVGAGENVLIAGLIIQGLDAKRVLVRAAGPALSPLGVSNFLADPRIRITTLSGSAVATNDNWGEAANAAAIAAATAQTGAFAFATGSRDAAALLTLAPGAYTVIVESATGAEGIALVEAYEVLP